jgi:hypothetical protein
METVQVRFLGGRGAAMRPGYPTVYAPNTVGNFCFEVTLGYRRVERGR